MGQKNLESEQYRIILRKATVDDQKDLLLWRNDVVTIANSFDQRVISFKEHERWLSEVLNDSGRLLLIGLEKDCKIGMVRFDRHGDYHEISVNIAPDFRGQGKATALLKESLNWVKGRILARVKKQNQASIRLFQKVGFFLEREFDGYVELETIAHKE